MIKQCLLCNNNIKPPNNSDFRSGLCNNCIRDIRNEAAIIPLKGQSQKLKNEIIKIFLNDDEIYKAAGFVNEQSHLTVNDLQLYGEVRQFSDSEKNKIVTCEGCKESIDTENYYLPVVVLECNHAIYHRECFAKEMAQNKMKCPECSHRFFIPK